MVGVKAVRLLLLDPDLGARLPPSELARAERDLLLLGIEVSRGIVTPEVLLARPEIRGQPIAAFVLEGVIIERLDLGDRPCARLLGPGDLIHTAGARRTPTVGSASFEVLEPAFVSVLDDRFLVATQRWPGLAAAVLERALDRAQEGFVAKAISQLPRVEDRLLALFRSLADRWGRVRSDGVIVELALTHDLIGELIGARRPTVSLGLRTLGESGQLRLLRGEGWLLTGERVAALSPRPPRPLPDAGPAEEDSPELLLIGVDRTLAGRLASSFAATRWAPTPQAALDAMSEVGDACVVVVDLTCTALGERAVELVELLRARAQSRVIALTEGRPATVPGLRLLAAAAHDHVHHDADPSRIAAAIVEQRAVIRTSEGGSSGAGSASVA